VKRVLAMSRAPDGAEPAPPATSVFGLLCAVAGVVIVAAAGSVLGTLAFAVLGLVAVTDIAVVARHIRHGPRFQPQGPAGDPRSAHR
jgi:xanthosine utilization system XapX-like protein